MQAVSLQFFFSNLSAKTLKPFGPPLPSVSTKDRPSNGSVYVPPHQRLRSVITTATSAASPSPNISPVQNADSKSCIGSNSSRTQVNSSIINHPYPDLFDLQGLRNKQAQETNSQLDSENVEVCKEVSDLQMEPLSQPRGGRAGRVQPGESYHLYPRCVFDAFADYQLPEILRTPLQSLCLQIKSLNLGSISEFLSRALQSPELLSVQNAIEYLKIVGALDEKENLTVLGRYLTKHPMEPKLGKMLLLGAIFNCLDPILTVVAGLSVRNPFLTPHMRRRIKQKLQKHSSLVITVTT